MNRDSNVTINSLCESIKELYKKESNALSVLEINDRLGLTTVEELEVLQDAIRKLIAETELYETKKGKLMSYENRPGFEKGVISVNKKGFAFIDFDDKNKKSIHISQNNMGLALDGDTVLVEVIEESKDGSKREGVVRKIVKRDLNNIVGSIKSDGKNLYFEPLERKNINLQVDKDSLSGCVEGEVVVVKILDDLGNNTYTCEVVKKICHKDDPKQDILTVAAMYNIYQEFPEEAMRQAEETPNEVTEEEFVNRRDLRDKVIFTIDGADTKDIDDAISLEVKDGYYLLGVHIADVSHYVTENSPLDIEAQKRGTSSYLADSVIPMLPHKLSNGICSLNPNVDRCAISCVMKIDSKGKCIESDIFESIIKSNKKMTYTDVNSVIEDNIIPEGYEEFADTLKAMNELAHIIRARRTRNGASDFDIEEPKIICDENGKAIDIKKRERGEGERLIEDFMVAANEAVASTLDVMDLPAIYRVHDIPDQEKIGKFIKFCSTSGIVINGKTEITNPKDFQKILDQIHVEGPLARVYKSLAVRSMKKAVYSSYNIGHFGLASRDYTHFTSPIRRYPDLMTHRLLRTYLFEHRLDSKTINYYENILESLAKLCSDNEQKAVECERRVEKMKMAEYMEDHIGEEFNGMIDDVSASGFYVQLDNLVEGKVLIQSLQGDYFVYDEELGCLIGSKTKRMFKIGDMVTVKVTAANKEECLIDFELSETLKLEDDIEKPKLKERKIK